LRIGAENGFLSKGIRLAGSTKTKRFMIFNRALPVWQVLINKKI
jgi:hypothetical protein